MTADIGGDPAFALSLRDAMAARAVYDREHPMAPLPDSVLTALERPEIEAARVAFLDYVSEATHNQTFPTNYYDKVLLGAIRAVSGEPNKVVRLFELYCDFVDALAPFQPDAATVRAAAAAPKLPWDDDIDNTAGKVFYFVPCSGGYWVEGGDTFREMLQSIKDALAAQ